MSKTPRQFDNEHYVDWSHGAFPELVTRTESPKPPKFVNGRRVDAKQFAKRAADTERLTKWCNSVDARILQSPFHPTAIEEILEQVQRHGGREFNESWRSWPPSKRLLRSALTDAEIEGVVEKLCDPMLFLPADLYFTLREQGKIRGD
jgi:hypothetical protein